MNLLIKFKNVFLLVAKIFLLDLKARSKKKNDTVILVAEFGNEGGALTYFKYIHEYFESKDIKYLLVLSKEQKVFLNENITHLKCINIIDRPEVWRPYFTNKNTLSLNVDLFINQLNELLFYSKLNVKYRPDYFYFSVTNPEHFSFEFCLPAKIFYLCHTLTYDRLDFIKRQIIKLNLNKNKMIIAVSGFAKNKIVESWNIKQSKIIYISVINNYYDLLVPKSENKSATTVNNILTIGSVENYKNPLLWCQIAKNLSNSFCHNNIHFYWVGSGSLLNECKKEVIGFNNIHFEGNSNNVEYYYSISNIYIQPSETESFGIAVAGAMAFKIPCIVSDAGGLPEIVLDTETGYIVRKKHVDTYVEKIKYLINNNEIRLKMGKNGYDRYLFNFSKKLWYQKMNWLLNITDYND